MNCKQFAQVHRTEYIEFCNAIINEYNRSHIDNMILSDVLDRGYTYELFYANFLVLS